MLRVCGGWKVIKMEKLKKCLEGGIQIRIMYYTCHYWDHDLCEWGIQFVESSFANSIVLRWGVVIKIFYLIK